MRKIFFLLLLLAGWAVIFWPVYSDNLVRPVYAPSNAHSSEKPLPPAWQNSQPVRITNLGGASGFPVTSSSASGRCGDTYIIQAGETLGEIARDCGLSLKDVLAANPRIPNPNRVYPGQQINLPDPTSGRGGAEAQPNAASAEVDASVLSESGYWPGTAVKIEAAGLPPSTSVRIGLGLSSSGYTVVGQSQSDADGRVTATLTIPAEARPGDTAFIMVSTRGAPAVQRMSEMFIIGN